MNKLELNDKLATLYNLPSKKVMIVDLKSTSISGNQKDNFVTSYALLIDDWAVLMILAVDNGLTVDINNKSKFCHCTKLGNNEKKYAVHMEIYADHESPQAATRFAIAMALVKLAEDKS